MSRRWLTGLMLVFLMFAVVSGNVFAAEKVKLTLWSELTQKSRIDAMQNIIARFEKANPNVEVEQVTMPWGGAMDKIVAAFLAGTPPDISVVGQGWPQSLSATGGLVPLNDVVERLGGPGKFAGSSLKVEGMLNGTVWALPLYVTPHAIVYRKSWMKEKGLDIPKNWDEFLKVAVALTDPLKNRYGYAQPFDIHGGKTIWAFLLTNNVTIFVPDGKGGFKLDFNNSRTVETYNYLANLISKSSPRGSTTYTTNEVRELIARGVIAMRYDTPETLLTVKDYNPQALSDFDYFPMPAKLRKGSGQGWVGLVVFKTPRTEIAKKFLEFLFKEENYLEHILSYPYAEFPAYIPVLNSREYVDGLPKELVSIARQSADILEYASGISMWHGPNPWAGEIENKLILPNALGKILVNKIPVEKAVAEAEAELKEVMKSR